MRGARGKTFEWGLLTSPPKTIHVSLPQTLKCIQFFQALFPVQFIYLLHFFVLGTLLWLGPGANCPPPPPPLSAGLRLSTTTIHQQHHSSTTIHHHSSTTIHHHSSTTIHHHPPTTTTIGPPPLIPFSRLSILLVLHQKEVVLPQRTRIVESLIASFHITCIRFLFRMRQQMRPE